MSTKQMAAEMQISERTAYRYLKLFHEHGIELNQTKFGKYTFQKAETKKRPAKRILNKMKNPNLNGISETGNIIKKTPIQTIFERFQFHPDFAKWLAENKAELLKAENEMLVKFGQFFCDSKTDLTPSVELFLKQYEDK
jgi:transposase